MNLQKRPSANVHRGLVGLEASLIIIALVIVAAVLSYVTLNMGFFTSQQAKTVIDSTIKSSSSNLEVEGKVIGSSFMPSGAVGSLNVTSIPIKVKQIDEGVNVDPTRTSIKFLSTKINYDNIYAGTLNAAADGPTFTSLRTAVDGALDEGYIDVDPYTDAGWPTETAAFIYWTIQSNTNNVIEPGEHANLVVVFAEGDRPEYLDKIRVELILTDGASLTVERKVPVITNEVVDLG